MVDLETESQVGKGHQGGEPVLPAGQSGVPFHHHHGLGDQEPSASLVAGPISHRVRGTRGEGEGGYSI